MYMYVCADRPCRSAVQTVTDLGLFAEALVQSPYERDEGDLDTDARCADAAFWDEVDALARSHGAVAIVEEAAWLRHYTMTAGGTRPSPRPGSRIAVWPQWEQVSPRRVALTLCAIRNLIRTRPESKDVELAEGLVWRWTPTPPDLYEEEPALRAITPGPGGSVSARWPAWVVEPWSESLEDC